MRKQDANLLRVTHAQCVRVGMSAIAGNHDIICYHCPNRAFQRLKTSSHALSS